MFQFQTEPNKDENGDGDSESESQNWESNPKGEDHYGDDDEHLPHEPEMDLDEVSLPVGLFHIHWFKTDFFIYLVWKIIFH